MSRLAAFPKSKERPYHYVDEGHSQGGFLRTLCGLTGVELSLEIRQESDQDDALPRCLNCSRVAEAGDA